MKRLPPQPATHWTLYKHASDDATPELAVPAFAQADVTPKLCSPFRLAPGESFSGFLAGVEFTPFTHHHVAFVDAANVQDAWLGTLSAFVHLAFASRSLRVDPVVTGAYVTRSASSQMWTLGIVTSEPDWILRARTRDLQHIQSYWAASISTFGGGFNRSTEAVKRGFSASSSGLPFCASQRQITVAAGWADDSVIDRIRPGKPLPAITLRILHDDSNVPAVFGSVRAFSGRGTEVSGKTTVQYAKAAKGGGVNFDALKLRATGEHLLLFEASPPHHLLPFVLPATCHVAPFRVVGEAR